MGRKAISIQELHTITASHGGKCLASICINAKDKLEWQCAKQHIWFASPSAIKGGTWCPDCCGTKKKNIDDMHALAALKNGKCLSKNYVNMQSKLLWQCENSHVWETTGNSISNGSWCSECNKITIFDACFLAELKGGKCLSQIYSASNLPLTWQCKSNHIWETSYSDIKKGTWCPECSYDVKRIKIEDIIAFAINKGGKLLSENYINNQTNLKWQCSEGHIWEANFGHIKNGTWCNECALKNRKKKYTIDDMQKIAEARGGQCLSTAYTGIKNKLLWQCKNNHQWLAMPDHIINGKTKNSNVKGTWCPYCKINHNQELCRKYLEDLFPYKFILFRPDWLINHNTGYKLELDGYCEELNLAFEYNGEHHYRTVRFNPSWSDDELENRLKSQKQRDRIKKKLCKKNNINLIVIPYWENNIQKFINKELKKLLF